jgi:RHS repeat-associated protein
VTSYQYDNANRLTSVNNTLTGSVSYTWDNNGNLLNDGVNTYTYNSANRLISVSNQSTVSSYQYNGMGDRLQQTVNGNTTTYVLDINSSLPEVLNDGQSTYIYGLDNIAQVNAGGTQYFLGDGLNSTRQLTDTDRQITLAQSYDPFGNVIYSAGNGQSAYGYTSEQTDPSGLVYLRARYYDPNAGRFTSRDTWAGNINQPLSLNQWNYVNGNPINYTDPSGYCAGYKGLDAPINTVLSLTAPFLLNGEHWKATGNAWKDAWNTCVESLQKAGAAFQRSDYLRAYLYASGTAASSHQAAERIGQINRELDIIWCKDASLGDKIVAWLDVGAWSIGIASFLAPIPYKGWLATKGAINNTYLSGLSIGVPDEFLPPSIRMTELGKLNVEHTLSTRTLAYETGTPITITGRWSDTISEAAWRTKAVARMDELISQGIPRAQAWNQAAQEFGIFQHQVKISTGYNEIDAYIPKEIWDNLSYVQQREITARLREIYGVGYVDWRQVLIPKPGWPNPANSIPPGSITFDPFGDIIHIIFGK